MEEFCELTSRLNLEKHRQGRVYDDDIVWLEWRESNDPPWWDPSPDLEDTWVFQEKRNWVFAKLENGWVYLKSSSH
jgi:hypothetical protein